MEINDKRHQRNSGTVGRDEEFMCAEERNARERIKELAATIKNNKQLRKIIRNAKPNLREQVYMMIIQHIRFVPLDFKRM
jgi:hypothetical protein